MVAPQRTNKCETDPGAEPGVDHSRADIAYYEEPAEFRSLTDEEIAGLAPASETGEEQNALESGCGDRSRHERRLDGAGESTHGDPMTNPHS